MHARTIRVHGDPSSLDRSVDVLNSQVIPQLRQFPGFQGAYWAADRESGKGIAFFFYGSEQNLRETADRAGQLRNTVLQAIGTQLDEVKEHEVVADTGEKVHATASHIRVTTIKTDPARREDGIARIKDTVIPTARGFPGFQGGFWLATLEGGPSLGCTLWDSRESLDGSRSMADSLRRDSAAATGAEVLGVEEFEITARADGGAAAG